MDDTQNRLHPFFRAADAYSKAIYQLGYSSSDASLISILVLLAAREGSLNINGSYGYHEAPADICHSLWGFLRKNEDLYNSSQFIQPVLAVHHKSLMPLADIALRLDLRTEEILYALDILLVNSEASLMASITSPSIAKLMVQLLDVRGGVVSDPAAGSGGLLREAMKHATAHQSDTYIGQGVELNQKIVFVYELYRLIEGIESINFQCGNGFFYFPDFRQSDYVLSNPPINRVNRYEAMQRYGQALFKLGRGVSCDMSLNFIQLGQSGLNEGGKAAYLVNMGVLFSSGDAREIRREWIERKELVAVISLPGNLLAHTTNKCAILLFEKNGSDSVRFLKADDLYKDELSGKCSLADDSFEQISKQLYADDHSCRSASVPYEYIASQDYSLHPDSYVLKEIYGIAEKISERWEPLGKLACIEQGTRDLSKCPEGDSAIIVGNDVIKIYNDKFIPSLKDLSSLKAKIVRAQENDILVKRLGSKPTAVMVPRHLDGLVIDQTVFLLRFYDLSEDQLHFICEFINSERGARHIASFCRSTTVQTLTKGILSSVDVPIANTIFQKLLVEATKAERVLLRELEKAQELKMKVFDGLGIDGVKDSHDDVKFSLKTLETALVNKDKISYKVAQQYPYPIAFPYRNIYMDREWAAIYDRQMKFGEQLLSFLASVGLAIANDKIDRDDSELRSIKRSFSESLNGGISPGNWLSLFRTSAKILQGLENENFAQEFSKLWYRGRGSRRSKFSEVSELELVNRLNDFKHHRGPAGANACEQSSASHRVILDEALLMIESISQWKLFICDDLDYVSSKSLFECRVRVLKGDHPCFESSILTLNRPISKGCIYIKINDDVVNLAPFIVERFNPDARKVEIYSLDKRTKKGEYILKSFETGSTMEADHSLTQELNEQLKIECEA